MELAFNIYEHSTQLSRIELNRVEWSRYRVQLATLWKRLRIKSSSRVLQLSISNNSGQKLEITYPVKVAPATAIPSTSPSAPSVPAPSTPAPAPALSLVVVVVVDPLC